MKPNNTLNSRRFSALRVALLCMPATLTFGSLQAAGSPQFVTQAPAQQAAPQAPAAQQAVPGQAPAQNPGICGNQPLCYETQDFAAVVTDFRTSKSGYFGLIATTLRFVNKTNGPLILGYANGSGTAQDDSGLRYGVGGANGVRGMGLVNAPYSIDAKFVLQPGGFGDARFELAARLTPVYGVTFELNLTVNEINALEGNQHTVGGEFPLQFQGLTNGARGTAPGAVMQSGNSSLASSASGMLSGVGGATPACGPGATATALAGATNSAAAQGAASTATSTVSSASAAISNITSIFGKKKQPVATTNAAATPCVPAAPVAAAAPAVPATTAAVPPASGTAPGASAAPATPAATTPAASSAAAKTVPVAAPKAAATPAKPAVKKPAPTTSTTATNPQKQQQP